MKLVNNYPSRHSAWNVKHYHAWYAKEGGGRSYNGVKKALQDAKLAQSAY